MNYHTYHHIKLNVKFEQVHIDNGDAGSCNSCPIALALRDALIIFDIEPEWFVHIDSDYMVISTKGTFRSWTCKTPAPWIKFIEAFDNWDEYDGKIQLPENMEIELIASLI